MTLDSPVEPVGLHAATLAEYVAMMAKNGRRVFPGQSGTYWVGESLGTFARIPSVHLGPAPDAITMLLKAPGVLASYVNEPDKYHPPNARLYTVSDRTYSLEQLDPVMRRNTRRGLREFSIRYISMHELLTYGQRAFCETRVRNGLDDGVPKIFRRRFATQMARPGISCLGAWRDEQLAAFLMIEWVDDWAEIAGFSVNSLLQFRPNEALVYTAVSDLMTTDRCRVVSYGLSSVQAHSSTLGLQRFKLKVGFHAYPVHRAFVAHPILRPFVNRASLLALWAALRFKPSDRRLRKAEGILSSMLGDIRMPDPIPDHPGPT